MTRDRKPTPDTLEFVLRKQLELMQAQLALLAASSLPPSSSFESSSPLGELPRLPRDAASSFPKNDKQSSAIAVIGMSGRFPGAKNIREFWQNLLDGKDSITHWSADEIDSSVPREERTAPNYGRSRGILADADKFDAEFFRISPREAKLIDPQQRIFLEIAYEALQDSGYDPDSFEGEVGVFGGVGDNFYHINNVLDKKDLIDKVGALTATVGNMKDYAATRISYKLNLKGPSVSLNTACSTSLVAVDQAVWALRNRTCDMALAGASTLYIPQKAGFLYGPGLPFSSDGLVRPFSADATGVLFSDGAGMVVLKRLEDAQRDGDSIYGVIIGTAINNDGLDKMSFFAPSAEGQTRVIRKAMQDAGISPRSLAFVEAHATGTLVGDPVEFQGLLNAFDEIPGGEAFCALGAFKGNIGHTDAAAGVTGLIKALLSLKHRMLPKNLHYSAPNPDLKIAGSPFYIPTVNTVLKPGSTPLRAGISAFGFGGTNSHVIIEEAPIRTIKAESAKPSLLSFSAETKASLDRSLQDFADFFSGTNPPSLTDAAFTLAHGRKAFRHRTSIAVRSLDEAIAKLKEPMPTREAEPQELAFIFPGQGIQYLGMGRSLYESEPAYRQSFDASAHYLESILGIELHSLIFAEGPEAEARLEETRFAQPAIFAVQLALLDLMESRGLQPSALVGHSLGELACAVRAGIFSRENALYLVAHRGRLMQGMAPGGMLSVNSSEADLQGYLNSTLSLAAVNGPKQCVLAGPREALARLKQEFEAKGIQAKLLRTSHAFHSPTVDAIRHDFIKLFEGLELKTPQIPIVSSLSGRWADPEQLIRPEYWADQMRGTVRFFEAIETLWSQAPYLLLELGPRDNASVLARKASKDPSLYRAINTLNPLDEEQGLLKAWGELWSAGQALDLRALVREGSRVSLPTYSFEKVSHWLEPLASADAPKIPLRPAFSEADKRPSAGAAIASHDVLPELIEWIEEVSGLRLRPEHAKTSFLELGFDSLSLTQLSAKMSEQLESPLSYKQMALELNTGARLSAYLRENRVAGNETRTDGLKARGVKRAPASHAQKRIWLHQQQKPDSGLYNIPVAFDLHGPISLPFLQDAANAVIQRHPILRTRYELQQTEVYQQIEENVPTAFEVLDLRQDPSKLQDHLDRDGRKPFSTSEVPVLRFHLYRLSEAHSVLLVNASHIAFDLLSIRNLMRELERDYAHLCRGGSIDTQPAACSYIDFAQWQADSFRAGELQRQIAYWKPRLAPIAQQFLKLPLAKVRPAEQPEVNVLRVVSIPKQKLQHLLPIATANGVNSFALLMAAYSSFLSAKSGQQQVAVGTTIASRKHPSTQSMLGFFANTLVLSLARQASESFLDYAMRFQSHIIEAFDHQDAPIEELVRALTPVRDPRYNTLFQTFFSFEKVQDAAQPFGEATIRFRCDVTRSAPSTDLNVWAQEHEEEFRFEVDYSDKLWSDDEAHNFIEDFLQHLLKLNQDLEPAKLKATGKPLHAPGEFVEICREILGLERLDREKSFAQQGGHSLLALRLITAVREKTGFELSLQDVLKAKSLGAVEALIVRPAEPRTKGLHEWFEESAAVHPQKIAVKYRSRTLTYAALEQKSNQVARYLQRLGVKPGECVGLAMDRSLDLIVAMLGILKSGAAYLPMDPAYPNDRLSYMAENSRLRWVLSEEEYAETLLLPTDVRLIEFDSERSSFEGEAVTPLKLTLNSDQLAYVIYTSGSTGKPKGVEIPHASASCFLEGISQVIPFAADDVLMSLTTISFDISVLEIFLTLGRAATLVLMEGADALDGPKLIRTLEQEKVSVFQATPSGWRILLDSGWSGSDRLIGLCGGEAFPRDLAERLIPRVREIHNVYGPTEATVWATSHRVQRPEDHKLIGRPLPGYSIWIVDEQLRQVPTGEVGRLYIGGSGLAAGYSHRPELTAERFVPSPFLEGERIYDTGDLALLRPNGLIEYVSRADDQVKIRGYRIELGEIEAVANSHPDVRLSAALVHEFSPGDQRIVLFVESRPGQELDSAALTVHLRASLPNYFLPNILRPIDLIPMTQNGKIDRKPLTALMSQAASESKSVATGSDLQTWLMDLWMEHLQSPGLNPRSKFFEQGGYSLLAVIVAQKMSERSGVVIGLNDLLSSTLEQLAAKMGQGKKDSQ